MKMKKIWTVAALLAAFPAIHAEEVDIFKPIKEWLMERMEDVAGLVYVSAGFMITLAALFYIYGGEDGKRWAKSMIRASIASVFIVKVAPLLIETF